jgi:hypothetical protein
VITRLIKESAATDANLSSGAHFKFYIDDRIDHMCHAGPDCRLTEGITCCGKRKLSPKLITRMRATADFIYIKTLIDRTLDER